MWNSFRLVISAQIGVLSLALFLAVANYATAAEVSLSERSSLCKIILTGPIQEGDLDRLMRVAEATFPSEDDVAESTAENTLCLNSPGGSFIEGIRIARYVFDRGIGTVVGDGDGCASACALIFMMGRAIGPEVAFINRRLHVGGTLGFHRPSLVLEDSGNFSSYDLELAYDLAVSSLVEFVILANKMAPWSNVPMVKADLLERIFATLGRDMFFVDTVEKAARWDIELIGINYPEEIDEVRAYYACENALQWEVGLHDQPVSFSRLALAGVRSNPFSVRLSWTSEPGDFFSVTSRKAGYADASCVVGYTQGWLRICGHDEYTSVKLGLGICADSSDFDGQYVSALALWKPETKLWELTRPWEAEEIDLNCIVHSATGVILDDEHCIAVVEPRGTSEIVYTFRWPTGSTTVIRAAGGQRELNGVRAESVFLEDFTACLVSTSTGNRFCFRDP
jgi:hypothetical protein